MSLDDEGTAPDNRLQTVARDRYGRISLVTSVLKESIAPSAMPASQTPAELELARLIVHAVNLDTVAPEHIDPEAPLFGAGLGLDSIDALEIALEISKRYGFQLRSDEEENRRIFASLRSLSRYIEEHRAKA
jgi:acyl carrier protein